MKKLGLTGNIGSGKSTVSRIFESLGIPVFYADKEAKALYQDLNTKKIITGIFGNHILNNASEIDFKLLADIVFNNKNKLKQLTNIIHPLVFEKYNNWINENSKADYSIHESAIIFEYSQQNHYYKTICVSSPLELRIGRVVSRDNSSIKLVKERINNQMLEIEKAKLSDFVIKNDNDSFLIPQVLEIHNILTQNKIH
jgi:dephospho-CoA kinase